MKSESEINFYPFYKICSINNNINPQVDILIESIDRFSFGEDIENEKNGEEKIKKSPPNNYSFMKTDNILSESNQRLKDLNSIINNLIEIKLISEENKNKRKICGIFNKEDFELKEENNKKKKNKNNQLNDSFEKKYSNPLKNILDDEEDKDDNISGNHNNNINKDLPIQKKEDITIKNENEKSDIKKDENLENKNIMNEINNEFDNNKNIDENKKNENEKEINKENNINVNNSNSNMKINNYDDDDDKEKEKKIKEINNSDTEIPFIGNLLPFKNKEKEPISTTNSQENPKMNNKDIDLPINKNEIDNNKIINMNSFDNLNDDGYESPRLGVNFIEEEKEQKEEKEEIKNLVDEIKENNSINNEEKIISDKEKEKLNNIDDLNKKNEQQMNLPLSLNLDNPLLKNNPDFYP